MGTVRPEVVCDFHPPVVHLQQPDCQDPRPADVAWVDAGPGYATETQQLRPVVADGWPVEVPDVTVALRPTQSRTHFTIHPDGRIEQHVPLKRAERVGQVSYLDPPSSGVTATCDPERRANGF